MSSTAVKMVYRLSHNGITMPVDDLEYEHVDILLSIWHLFQNFDVALVSGAFGGENKYSLDDIHVRNLFDWKYLNWKEKDVSFELNIDGTDRNEITERWIALKAQCEERKGGA